MAFCRNCGSEISENSKFCNNCGTSTESGSPSAAPASPRKRDLGAQLDVHYANTDFKKHTIFLTCFVCIGLFVVLLVFSIVPVFSSFPKFVIVLGWAFLVFHLIWQIIIIKSIDQNVLRICENGVRGVAATGILVNEFSIPYDDITRVNIIAANHDESVYIHAYNNVYICHIREPRNAKSKMEKYAHRPLL